MSELKISNLLSPFLPAQHPRIQEVEQQAVARWAERLGLSAQDKEYVMLCRSRFATLVGHAHPSASLENLEPVVDFLFWIFLWDDQFDCRIGGQLVQPAALYIQNMLAAQVLEGTSPNADSSPLLQALEQMRGWLEQHMPAAWMARFKRSFERYFNSTVWELEQRHLGLVPDLSTYVEMRRLTSGGYWVTHLIEVAEGICLTDEVWSHPAMQELLTATANIIGWANDVLSLRSELRDSGHLNLVLCIKNEYGLPLQEAADAAVWMHNAEVRRFLKLKAQLPSFGEADGEVDRFVRGLCRWMRANIDWSILTGRYQVDASELLGSEGAEEPAFQMAC
jgi:hypothetical protein